MADSPVLLVSGSRKGIGRHLVDHYSERGYSVIGCSRKEVEDPPADYRHFLLDIADEDSITEMFRSIRETYGRLDVLINNAGIASINHIITTPGSIVRRILETNVLGTYLMCREAARLMQRRRWGRIVNFSSVATPLKLEGEAAYASSKAAVVGLTEILARELSPFGVTVNAIGPGPVKTDLIRRVPEEKLNALLERQAIHRYSELSDISNVIDFFIRPESEMVTGQTIYLGGV